MTDTQTTLVLADAATLVLPTKEDFEDTIGHVFLGRLAFDDDDVLFLTTLPETDVQFVVLHPVSCSGMCFEYQDLDTTHYRPISDIVYNVTVAG
jgi:hypothetical protein